MDCPNGCTRVYGERPSADICSACPDKDNCLETPYDRVKAEQNSYQEPFVGCQDD